jgi:hypothetical protein
MEGGNIRGGNENFERNLGCLVFWNGKIVLIRGKSGEGEEERNCQIIDNSSTYPIMLAMLRYFTTSNSNAAALLKHYRYKGY